MVRKTAKTVSKGASPELSSDSTEWASDSSEQSPQEKPTAPAVCDPNLWYIHGNSYDLHEFVNKHPGGRMAILTGRGRDCTALFESYHPWNDKHRKVLKAYGAAPPPPDPFYEEIKERVREAFPAGCGSTKMRTPAKIGLALAWSFMSLELQSSHILPLGPGCHLVWHELSWSVSFGRFSIGCANSSTNQGLLAGCFVATEWVNRACLFCGFFIVGPSLCWYYQHVVSHHVSTNQDGDKERDVDVEYIWLADLFPGWLKVLSLPGIFIGAVVEIGIKRMIVDLLIRGHVGGHKVDYRGLARTSKHLSGVKVSKLGLLDVSQQEPNASLNKGILNATQTQVVTFIERSCQPYLVSCSSHTLSHGLSLSELLGLV
ncbi:unnamed protein product [Effrenium voratum]|uniref:Cytochrome b5 heme-binding domain-containing protein n=1 Tax=Effrenium voratum TaxID=2562239 RepID=A0AA36N6D3_9DINO|nr:unnamed protein product [Effrenium voratum]